MNGLVILSLELATISEAAQILLLLMEEVAVEVIAITVTRWHAKALGATGEVARSNLAVRLEKC